MFTLKEPITESQFSYLKSYGLCSYKVDAYKKYKSYEDVVRWTPSCIYIRYSL